MYLTREGKIDEATAEVVAAVADIKDMLTGDHR